MNRAGPARFDPVAVGLIAGFVTDRVFADPARWHPVAGFGSLAAALERRIYAPATGRGMVHVGLLVGGAVGVTAALDRAFRPAFRPAFRAALRPALGATRQPALRPARAVLVAVCTWAVLGGRTLEREAHAVHARLAAGDLPGARTRVARIVGRDTTTLSGAEVARACVESVAENTADAVVAPLLWGALVGAPGLVGYRAVNTLDAMVGHLSPRYRDFGWAAAKLDDLANWLPARLTVATTVLSSPPSLARQIVRTVRRDAPAHPSPNAGRVEAAAAAALGVQLGGTNHYRGQVEDRGTLGDGRPVETDDILAATRLARRTALVSLAVVLAGRVTARRLLAARAGR